MENVTIKLIEICNKKLVLIAKIDKTPQNILLAAKHRWNDCICRSVVAHILASFKDINILSRNLFLICTNPISTLSGIGHVYAIKSI